MKVGKNYKLQYDHKNRICEFPGCGKPARKQGRQHLDGSVYSRPWCRAHLSGSKRQERVEYAKDIKKYLPKNQRLINSKKS